MAQKQQTGISWQDAPADEHTREVERLLRENNALLRESMKIKTTAELVTAIRESSTPDEWREVVDMRIKTASLGECVDFVAQSNGYRDFEDMQNSSPGSALKNLFKSSKDATKSKEDELKAKEKERK
jgi:hypothetical protein